MAPSNSVFLGCAINHFDDPISSLDQSINLLTKAAIGFLKLSDQFGKAFRQFHVSRFGVMPPLLAT